MLPPGSRRNTADGIVFSSTIHEAVAGRLKATFDDLGNLALKKARPAMVVSFR